MKRTTIMQWIKKYVKKVIAGTLIAITIGGTIVPAKEIIPSFKLNDSHITYYTQAEMNQRVEKKVIAIEAGHGVDLKTMKGDPGAIGVDGITESERNMELARILKTKLEQKGYEVILVRDGNYEMSLGAKQRRFNEINPSLSLSVHFNSSENPKGTGSEVLCNHKALDKYGENLAMDVAKGMAKAQGIPNRGVVHVGEGNGERRLYTRSNRISSANLLLEVCFTSNQNDINNYNNSKYSVAQNVADVIANYLK